MPKNIDEELPKGHSLFIQTFDDEGQEIELEIRQPTFREMLHVHTLRRVRKLNFDWKKDDLVDLGIDEVFGLYENKKLKAISGGRWVKEDYMLVQIERLDKFEQEEEAVISYKAVPVILAFLSDRCLNEEEDGWLIIESKSDDYLIDYYIEQTKGVNHGPAPYKESVKLIVVNSRRQEELIHRIIKEQRRTHHGE